MGPKDNEGRLYLSKLVSRFSSVAIWGDHTGKQVSRVLLRPLAAYFDRKGWSSGSVLAIAHPPIENEEAQPR